MTTEVMMRNYIAAESDERLTARYVFLRLLNEDLSRGWGDAKDALMAAARANIEEQLDLVRREVYRRMAP